MADPRTNEALADTAAARRSAGVYEGPVGVLTLVGPDARRFCNGMFTNNIRNLPVGRANQNAMVDEKARLQGLHDVACLGDEGGAACFRVTLEGVTVEQFVARYEKYIIFDDVELEDVSEAWRVLTVQGPEAASRLVGAGLPVPANEGDVCAIEGALTGGTVTRRARSVAGGFDVCVSRADGDALAQRLGGLGDPATLERLRVEAGLVRWPVDMGERALPHEMNVVPRMCSFEKGCYIGQEVINRIDVMGQVNKKVWGLVADDLLEPGAEVRLGEEEVGKVLSGVQEDGFTRSLALLRKAAWTPGTTVDAGGVAARVSALPFAAP